MKRPIASLHLLKAVLGESLTSTSKRFIVVSKNPQSTKYPWGDISEIAGRKLELIEQNRWGDCLCVCEKGLVDVGAMDVDGPVIIERTPLFF